MSRIEDALSRLLAPMEEVVTPELVAGFGRATLEKPLGPGDPVNPIVLARFVIRAMDAALAELGVTSGLLLLHLDQEIVLHGPIPVGLPLTVTPGVAGLVACGLDQAVELDFAVHRGDGALLAELRSTLLRPGIPAPVRARRSRPRLRVRRDDAAVTARVVRTIGAGNVAAYAEASGDRNPMHLDEKAARSVGLSGCLVHGMCLFGTVLAASRRLARPGPWPFEVASARFMRPVPVGATTEIVFYRRDPGYAFSVDVLGPAAAPGPSVIGVLQPSDAIGITAREDDP